MIKNTYLDEPWPLRMLAIAMLLASYFLLYQPLEHDRVVFDETTGSNLEHARLAEDAFRHAHLYMALAQQIRRELGDVQTNVDENQSVAYLLMDLDRLANERHVLFVGLDPQRSQASSTGLQLILHVRGHYGDVLHYLGDISLARSLLDIQSLDLERGPDTVRAGESPTIDANVHVTLVRFPHFEKDVP
jgi:hypothetical protein